MILAVDSETSGLDWSHGCRPFLIIATDGIYEWHWWGQVNRYDRSEVIWNEDDLEEIQNLLLEADEIIFHNSKFDLHMLECIGICIRGLWDKVHDTMIQSHIVCSGESHGLKYLAYKYLEFPEDDEEDLVSATEQARNSNTTWDKARKKHPTAPGEKKGFVHADYWMVPEECLQYGFGDVHRTLILYLVFSRYIKRKRLWDVYEERRNGIEPIYYMECQGYHVYLQELKDDIEHLKESREMSRRQIQYTAKFPRYFDPKNKTDIRDLFNINLKLESPIETEKGNQSFNKVAIDLLIEQNPEVIALQHLQEYNRLQTKIQYLSSYLVWEQDSYLHPNYWITGTRETRLSCERPNIQNLDRTSRHYFGPPQGYYWIDMDLENIEMAIWIYEVGNEELIRLFEAGQSIHLFIASLIPKLKEIIDRIGISAFKKLDIYIDLKGGNFSIIYGATETKADATYGISGAYRIFANRCPEVPEQQQRTMQEVLDNLENSGKPFVTTLGGYQLEVPLSDIFKACNYKIQGSAGYIMLRGMNRVYKCRPYIKSGGRMSNQVHDSLVIQQKLIGGIEDHESLAKEYCHYLTDESLLKTCRASYEIKYHPSDKIKLGLD